MNLLELWRQRDAVDRAIERLADGWAETADGRRRQDALLACMDERAEIGREIQRVYLSMSDCGTVQ